MKLVPGMHIGLHLVFFGKTGVTDVWLCQYPCNDPSTEKPLTLILGIAVHDVRFSNTFWDHIGYDGNEIVIPHIWHDSTPY
jgi:hypothetical protein